MIRMNNIHIAFPYADREVRAVNGITFDVNAGDYLALVGPAGSGKSTLIAALAGLIFPNQGEVYVDRFNIHKISRSERARIRAEQFGIIFQFSEMLGRFSVLENLEIAYQKPEIDTAFNQRLDYLCERLEMRELLNRYPSKLSGGQLQKAAIAVALIRDLPYILADEPSGDLDPHSTKLLQKLLSEEHKAGKTIILVTHDMNLASKAKDIYEIVDGNINRIVK